MRWQRKKNIWPYLAALSCLFLLSLFVPKAWQRHQTFLFQHRRGPAMEAARQAPDANRREVVVAGFFLPPRTAPAIEFRGRLPRRRSPRSLNRHACLGQVKRRTFSSHRSPPMTRRSLRVGSFPLLAALLAAAGILAMASGCTSVIGRGGSGLLRAETETAAFREAVEKDNGIPTATQAGVAACK